MSDFILDQYMFGNEPDVGNDVLFDALVNKATVLGYTLPSSATLEALNTLIKDMRRIGMIQRLDLFHVYASDLGDNVPFRLMNIVNAEMIGVSVGGIAWTNQGSKGNGTDGYVDTNYFPSVGGWNYQQNNASFGSVVYDNNGEDLSKKIVGSLTHTTSNSGTLLKATSNTAVRINSAPNSIVSPSVNLNGVGFKLLNRNLSTSIEITNRYELYIRISNSSSIMTGSLKLHQDSSPTLNPAWGNFFGDLGISCAFAGASISFEMAQNFRHIYNKYLRTIGLQQVA